jgi:hypothetical protein
MLTTANVALKREIGGYQLFPDPLSGFGCGCIRASKKGQSASVDEQRLLPQGAVTSNGYQLHEATEGGGADPEAPVCQGLDGPDRRPPKEQTKRSL